MAKKNGHTFFPFCVPIMDSSIYLMDKSIDFQRIFLDEPLHYRYYKYNP